MSGFPTEKSQGVVGNGDAFNDDPTDALIKSEQRLLRKIDWHLLPFLCVLYALSLIDR